MKIQPMKHYKKPRYANVMSEFITECKSDFRETPGLFNNNTNEGNVELGGDIFSVLDISWREEIDPSTTESETETTRTLNEDTL